MKKRKGRIASGNPEALIVLGSGFHGIAREIKTRKVISFRKVSGLARTTAPGHAGNLIFGDISGREVLVADGRLHVYEGYSAQETTFAVRWAASLGVKRLVTTNLSGAINPGYSVGDLMVVLDHINLSGCTPLIWNRKEDRVFVDMFDAYSPRLIALLEESARKAGVVLHKGVLAYLTGPSFETRAELKMLRALGADAVGWSLVPEILEARRCGMEACGIVCVSDLARPETFGPVDLDSIYRAGKDCVPRMKNILFELVSRL